MEGFDGPNMADLNAARAIEAHHREATLHEEDLRTDHWCHNISLELGQAAPIVLTTVFPAASRPKAADNVHCPANN